METYRARRAAEVRERGRTLRRDQTPAERVLWRRSGIAGWSIFLTPLLPLLLFLLLIPPLPGKGRGELGEGRG
jgi:hypothetical protein